jgi:hypothetical protein
MDAKRFPDALKILKGGVGNDAFLKLDRRRIALLTAPNCAEWPAKTRQFRNTLEDSRDDCAFRPDPTASDDTAF